MKKTIIVQEEGQAMLADALRQIKQPSRRLFLQRSLTLGGLSLLTGCNVSDPASIETALTAVSRFNDKVQGWLFDPHKLAPTYPDSMITRPFPFNAYYGEDEVEEVDGDAWRLELSGLIADKKPWTLPQLRALPQETQITRHICVEGWSAIGKWGGVPFSHFLKRVGADTRAKYIGFRCADDYFTSIDMATALHPQTIMALTYDGRRGGQCGVALPCRTNRTACGNAPGPDHLPAVLLFFYLSASSTLQHRSRFHTGHLPN
jgi:DMSO/TMAO reductase YedYZ molybdopterin-dependent catalytic subunit